MIADQLGKRWQVVDVHMGVDEAALHLHHVVVSILCILLVIEEELTSKTMMAKLEKIGNMSSLVGTQASPL